MNPGDRFSDRDGRSWIAGQALGTGSWSRSVLVHTPSGDEAVLRVPLTAADLGGGPEAERRAAACRDRAGQLATLLEAGPPWAPALIGRATADDGRPLLLLRRYPSTATRRIDAGAPLTEVLRIAQRTAAVLREAGRVHGALHGRNILLDEAGRPVLADPWTPAAARCGAGDEGARPPESAATPDAGWDTWALCALLYQAALSAGPGADGRRPLPVRVPATGLDKVALATLKDRALARLAAERTNPRFRGRLADRLGAVLNRGLSRDATPSPPYRFQSLSALLERLGDVVDLVDPRVEEVGRVLLPADARDGVFQGTSEVTFAVTVATSTTVDSHEDLVCGVAVRDLDAEGEARVPVPDARYEVKKHPSGRLRFGFTLPGVDPGRYRVRVAFAVKDSGHPPTTAQGEVEVRPPPGWVPPVPDPAPKALAFPTPSVAPGPAASAVAAPTATAAPTSPEPAPPSTPVPAPQAVATPTASVHRFPSPVAPPAEPAPLPGTPTPVQAPRVRSIREAMDERTAPRTPAVEVEIDVSDPGTLGVPEPTDAAKTMPQARPAGVSSSAATAPYDTHAGARDLGTDAEGPAWSGPGHWEDELPGPELGDGFDESPLPGPHDGGEDLFDIDDDPGTFKPPGALDRALEVIRRDTYTSVVAAVAGCLILVVILTLVLRSC